MKYVTPYRHLNDAYGCIVLSPKINLFSISSLIQFIFDRMNISSHIMKDIGVTNKVGISDVLLFDKF